MNETEVPDERALIGKDFSPKKFARGLLITITPILIAASFEVLPLRLFVPALLMGVVNFLIMLHFMRSKHDFRQYRGLMWIGLYVSLLSPHMNSWFDAVIVIQFFGVQLLTQIALEGWFIYLPRGAAAKLTS